MAVLRLNQKIAVGAVFVSAMFMNIMDITIVNVALPTIGRDFHIAPDGRGRRRDRVSGQPRCLHPRIGMARRSLRWQAGAHRRHHRLHVRLGPLRLGPEHDPARRVPGYPRRGRRDDGTSRHGHALPGLPTVGARPGGQHPDGPNHDGPRSRPGGRGLPGHGPLVAMGLLRQPPASGLPRWSSARSTSSAPGAIDAGRFDMPGFLLGGAGLGLLMYGVSEGPLKSGRHRGRHRRCLVGHRPARRLRPWWSCEPRDPWSTSACSRVDCSAPPTVVMFLAAAAFLGTLYLDPALLPGRAWACRPCSRVSPRFPRLSAS